MTTAIRINKYTSKFMKKSFFWIALPLLIGISCEALAATNSYAITVSNNTVSNNDELFIINGEKFEAQTYCFNMNVGDKVIFLEGSPLGACASAELLNLHTNNRCRVWCQ